MIQQSEIEKYGDKAAILNHILEHLPEAPILPYKTIDARIEQDNVLDIVYGKIPEPWIVRSSSPYSFGNFEGLFRSVPNVDDFDLESALHKIKESAESEDVLRYAEQHGIDNYKPGHVHFIIQQQSRSIKKGGILRHPNNPDALLMIHYEGEGRFEQTNYKRILHSENGLTKIKEWSAPSTSEELQAINWFKKIEQETNIYDGSIIMEFGMHPFSIYEIKPFKPFSTVDFDVPEIDDKDGVKTDLCFGTTPEEGIVMPVVKTVGFLDAGLLYDMSDFHTPGNIYYALAPEFATKLCNAAALKRAGMITEGQQIAEIIKATKYHNLRRDEEMNGPYAFITTNAAQEEYSLDLTIPNVHTVLSGNARHFFGHDVLRTIKQAPVFMNEQYLGVTKFMHNLNQNTDQVRVISNGKNAILYKE